jgi:acetyl-CoA acyltransferase
VPEAVLVSALRTPITTAIKGTLRDTTAYELADHVIGAAAAGLDPTGIGAVTVIEVPAP